MYYFFERTFVPEVGIWAVLPLLPPASEGSEALIINYYPPSLLFSTKCIYVPSVLRICMIANSDPMSKTSKLVSSTLTRCCRGSLKPNTMALSKVYLSHAKEVMLGWLLTAMSQQTPWPKFYWQFIVVYTLSYSLITLRVIFIMLCRCLLWRFIFFGFSHCKFRANLFFSPNVLLQTVILYVV